MDSTDRASMLFCPPFPPLRLFPGEPAAIGRHSSCALVVRKEDVSRRHAEVIYEGGGYVVRDLGSTNGTFVNGEPVRGPRPLTPGDRIEIGSSTITFCQVEAEVGIADDEPAGEKTMIADRLPQPGSDAFRGSLAEIPPDALLQLLEMGRKSGMLVLEADEGEARLWLEGGAPVHASTEKNVGFDAAMSVVTLDRGRFRFEPGVTAEERTIKASVTELLLEASRQQDEANR